MFEMKPINAMPLRNIRAEFRGDEM